MSKRKLTQRQSAIVNQQQQKRMQQVQHLSTPAEQDSLHAVQMTGLLVALYGTEAEVETEKNKPYRCKLRQNLGTIVVGDRVVWRALTDATGVIEAVLPRNTLLSRPIKERGVKAIAANIDQVCIVIAPQPKPVTSLLDSYLVVIETLGLTPIIVLNKVDLLTIAQKAEFDQWLANYRQLHYTLVEVSAVQQQGLAALQSVLAGRTSVIVGQSGVGKSSLLRCLLPKNSIRVCFETEHGHGLHTTTTARLYHLPSGGQVIDSPGVRDFVLWNMPPHEIAAGFKEFQPYLGSCRFRDCDHSQLFGCALQQAVQDGNVSMQRFTSYQRVVEFLTHLKR